MRMNFVDKICKNCKVEFTASDVRRVFCSQSCSAKYSNRERGGKPMKQCASPMCEMHIQHRSRSEFCSTWCRQFTLWVRWKEGEFDPSRPNGELASWFRDFLVEHAVNKCEQCGWNGTNVMTGKSVLQVDHINGLWYDNKYGNLQVLCPNCHAMTWNFGALNKGRGRSVPKPEQVDVV